MSIQSKYQQVLQKKMASKTKIPLKKCAVCDRKILSNEYLKCMSCNKYIDVACTSNVTLKFFRIMTTKTKDHWKCHLCTASKKRKNENSEQMTTPSSTQSLRHDQITIDTESTPKTNIENVTMRKKFVVNVSTENSFQSLSDEDLQEETVNTISCQLNRSCPEVRTNYSQDLTDLNEKIEILQSKLGSAEAEIENLLSENFSCQKIIAEQKTKIELLTRICKSPNKRTRKSTNNKILNTTNFSPTTATTDSNTLNSKFFTPQPNASRKINSNIRNTPPKIKKQNNEQMLTKTKICMLSSNKRNSILKIAQHTFKNSEICHYVTPNCGLKEMINNLQNKLKSYTKQDYCIILIGEEDFYKTKDYFDIILKLRETLQEINNTNLILCLPTYKFTDFSTMFNSRMEIFNNLLYLDIHTHGYAKLLDSNLYLSYDYDMFHKYYGSINNYGMEVIFDNINKSIVNYKRILQNKPKEKYITREESKMNTKYRPCNNNLDFFLL